MHGIRNRCFRATGQAIRFVQQEHSSGLRSIPWVQRNWKNEARSSTDPACERTFMPLPHCFRKAERSHILLHVLTIPRYRVTAHLEHEAQILEGAGVRAQLHEVVVHRRVQPPQVLHHQRLPQQLPAEERATFNSSTTSELISPGFRTPSGAAPAGPPPPAPPPAASCKRKGNV